MTLQELSKLVGQEVTLPVPGGLTIRVQTIDARVSYGGVQVLVTPVAGDGQAWVVATRLVGLAGGQS